MIFEKEQAETVKHMGWVLKRQAIMMGGNELIMSFLQICGYEENGRATHGPVRWWIDSDFPTTWDYLRILMISKLD